MRGGLVKKTPLLKKICSLTSLFFTFYKQLISTDWRVYINYPGLEAFADTAMRWRIIMAIGERRSRQKKDVSQKVTSTHLSIFQMLQTIDFRLEGLLQCSPPGGLCGHGEALEDHNGNR